MVFDKATPEDARDLVLKAVGYYTDHGRDQFLQELNNPNGQFHQDDLYAFAYDRKMTMIAHPINPKLVGVNLLDKKDWAGGKFFRREIQETALTKGSGWVEYEYQNPANKQIEPKITYIELADDMIICAGAYRGSGGIVAVVGIDSDAKSFDWETLHRAFPAIILTLSLLFIVTAGSIFNTRCSRSKKNTPVCFKHLDIIITVWIGLSISLFATWIAYKSEEFSFQKSFDNIAAVKTSGMGSSLREIRDIELEGTGPILRRFHRGQPG